MSHANFNLTAVPPFRLDLTVWALRRRGKNMVDRWAGQSYSRVLVFQNVPVKITIDQRGAGDLHVNLQSRQDISPLIQAEARSVIQKMLGVMISLEPFYTIAEWEVLLASLAQQFRGVKPPRFPSVFEALVNAIACQQVSLDSGIALLGRLSESFGLAYTDDTTLYAFPRPEDLIDAPEEKLGKIGFSRQKTQAIKELAYRTANGEIDLASLETAGNEEALAYLQKVRGIGRWSGEYALLRGLGRLDVFPGDDIGGQNNLQQLLHLDARPNYEGVRKLTSAWSPYQGFVYFHLLLQKLAARGLL